MHSKTPPYIVGFVRDHPRHKIGPQRSAMEKHGIRKVYTDLPLMIRQRIKGIGDVVAVTHAMLLADPKDARKKGGLSASFYRAFDALEAKGVAIWELSTDLNSTKLPERDKITRNATQELSRSRALSDKVGRPPRVWPDRELQIMKLHYYSTKHPRDADALAAIQAAGVKITYMQLRHALGPSGRSRIKAAAKKKSKR